MRRALAALLAGLALPLSVSCDRPAGDKQSSADGFRQFWSEFRQAALAGDKEKVASLTWLPFKTRGPLDSDPVRTYERAAFLAVFDKLLARYLPDPDLHGELWRSRTTRHAPGGSGHDGCAPLEPPGLAMIQDQARSLLEASSAATL